MGELQVSVDQLADAIRRTQRNCRGHVADPVQLAGEVIEQLTRAQEMAVAIGLTVADLHVTMFAWEKEEGQHIPPRTTTIVEVSSYPRQEIRIRRSPPPVNSQRSVMTMVVPAPAEVRRA